MSRVRTASEWSPYDTRDAAAKLGGCVRQRTAGTSVRSWGLRVHVHFFSRLSGIRTVVHGDDFMSGGPRHQLQWLEEVPDKTLRVEAHSDGSVHRAAWEKKFAREVFGRPGGRFVVALLVGASAKKRAETLREMQFHLEGRGERIEKALETRSWRAWNLTFASSPGE